MQITNYRCANCSNQTRSDRNKIKIRPSQQFCWEGFLQMKTRTPQSIRFFLISVFLFVLVFIAATILSHNPENNKYAVYSVPFLLICFVLSAVGIYSGATKKFEEKGERIKNRIGIIGNTLIFLIMLSLIIAGAIIASHQHR
ncbi:hypothetical protein BH09BAC5_BH09BAC5_08630 [soil metagenome]